MDVRDDSVYLARICRSFLCASPGCGLDTALMSWFRVHLVIAVGDITVSSAPDDGLWALHRLGFTILGQIYVVSVECSDIVSLYIFPCIWAYGCQDVIAYM